MVKIHNRLVSPTQLTMYFSAAPGKCLSHPDWASADMQVTPYMGITSQIWTMNNEKALEWKWPSTVQMWLICASMLTPILSHKEMYSTGSVAGLLPLYSTTPLASARGFNLHYLIRKYIKSFTLCHPRATLSQAPINHLALEGGSRAVPS